MNTVLLLSFLTWQKNVYVSALPDVRKMEIPAAQIPANCSN